ncbi:hypothetical protein BaOVIS_011430 [Babesia ovis]|uniref:Uncharacterized protein n=1 Tax=Babesia ovis TaxID=5869 RepID=A0A9W5TDI2_BABOV|nr:hypothetical protein BaOVIS_011430 [Babesia ovis]
MPSDADPPGGSDAGPPSPVHDTSTEDGDSFALGGNYFDVEGLDEKEKNLLLFMCLSSYLDWQDRFSDAYKELLVHRSLETRSADSPHNDTLYSLLREAISRQKRLMRSDDRYDDDDEESVVSADLERQSLLRTLMYGYNFEVYVKAMLLAFLLKMSPLTYMIITVLYFIYVFVAVSFIRFSRLPFLNWRVTRKLIRALAYIHRMISRFISYIRRVTAPRAFSDALTAARRNATNADPGAHVASTPPQPGEDNQNAPTQQHSFIAKIMYQTFGAFFLSVMPWWEPNPAYID